MGQLRNSTPGSAVPRRLRTRFRAIGALHRAQTVVAHNTTGDMAVGYQRAGVAVARVYERCPAGVLSPIQRA